MNKKIVSVLGASGYTGYELLRLLYSHPGVEVGYASAQVSAGKALGEVFPDLVAYEKMTLLPIEEALESDADLVFSCLPHHEAMEAVPKFLKKKAVKVVDLSADFRIEDPKKYEKWYGKAHASPDLLREAVYGLPELNRDKIRKSRLTANPGCYPTSVLLGLAPLLQEGLVDDTIIVDSKSGVSGAGRTPSLKTHFVETNESVAPYSIGRVHRHLPEMEQEASRLTRKDIALVFSPHLIPMSRGIVSTIYVKTTKPLQTPGLGELYRSGYAREPFVRFLTNGKLPETRAVRYSNRCDIAAMALEEEGMVVIVSAIDNLVKGASGQAIQNMNLMLGFEETLGLPVQGCAN